MTTSLVTLPPTGWIILAVLSFLMLYGLLLTGLSWYVAGKIVAYKNDKVVPVGKWHYEFGNFSGAGDERYWSGKIPAKVRDYTKPRYVLDNGEESERPPLPGSARWVVGYRISPTLVIHSMLTCNCFCDDDIARAFQDRYGGSFLTYDDALVLQQNWNKVSEMRQKAGDTPLPEPVIRIRRKKRLFSRRNTPEPLAVLNLETLDMASGIHCPSNVILKR